MVELKTSTALTASYLGPTGVTRITFLKSLMNNVESKFYKRMDRYYFAIWVFKELYNKTI